MKFQQHAGMNLVYRRYPLDLFLKTQRSLGVENIEFWAGYPHFPAGCARAEDVLALRRQVDAYGLRTVAVTMPSLGYQYQYCPVGEKMRRKCLAYFFAGIELARALQAPIMTINSGWSYHEQPDAEGFRAAGSLIAELCGMAAENGVTLALESLTPLETNLASTLDTTQRLLDAVGDDRLGLTIDTGACVCSGETSHMWFERFGKRVVHAHFVDGKRDSVGHFVWGEGTLDLMEELSAYDGHGYTGYLSSELGAGRYGLDPVAADERNVAALKAAMRFGEGTAT